MAELTATAAPDKAMPEPPAPVPVAPATTTPITAGPVTGNGLMARAPSPLSTPASVVPPGGGRPLPPETRDHFGARFGQDFTEVRVHQGAEADASARALGARAFTVGKDIVLGAGIDESSRGQRIIAHELAHVVQQSQGHATVQRLATDDGHTVTRPGDAAEDEAERAADQVTAPGGGGAPPRLSPTGPAIAGDWLDDAVDYVGDKVGAGAEAVKAKAAELKAKLAAKVKAKLAVWARATPGYPLVTTVIGRDPITDQPVPRTPAILVRTFLGLVPGGEEKAKQLEESGAIDRAVEWLTAELAKLDITWDGIKALFAKGWDSLSVDDLADPAGAWKRIGDLFAAPIGRLLRFVGNVASKVVDLVFDAVMAKAGPLGARVMGMLRRAGAVITSIVADPVGFLRNLLAAGAQGFEKFATNIGTHLQTGITGWLLGTLANAGIKLPETLDPKGVLSLTMQVLGITYQSFRSRMAAKIGEPKVALMEKGVELVKIMVTDGVEAAWEKLGEFIGDLSKSLIDSTRDWVVTKVVTAAVTKLATMFNPVGAVIQAILAIYNFLSWLIERIEQILALVEAVTDSIANIAAGKVEAAASYLEKTMARTLPLIISFLASQVGLGGISDKIRSLIKNLQGRVTAAMDRLIDFIINAGKALWGGAKKAAAAIKDYLFPRKKFAADGVDHELYIDESKPDGDLMVESTPKRLTALLDAIEASGPTDDQLKAIKNLRPLVKVLEAAKKIVVKKDDDAAKAAKSDKVDKALTAMVEDLKKLLVADFGRKDQPLTMKWVKPKTQEYKPLYIGPRVKKGTTITQTRLKNAFGSKPEAQALIKDLGDKVEPPWNGVVEEYKPHDPRPLPDGGASIGLADTWRLPRNEPHQVVPGETTEGGDVLLSKLERYGYSASENACDADHAVEVQIGGKPADTLANLWPLDLSVNRRSGSTVRGYKFPHGKAGAEVDMKTVKKVASTRDVWIKIDV